MSQLLGQYALQQTRRIGDNQMLQILDVNDWCNKFSAALEKDFGSKMAKESTNRHSSVVLRRLSDVLSIQSTPVLSPALQPRVLSPALQPRVLSPALHQGRIRPSNIPPSPSYSSDGSASDNATVFDSGWIKRTEAALQRSDLYWLTTRPDSDGHWLKFYKRLPKSEQARIQDCKNKALIEDTYEGADGAECEVQTIGMIDALALVVKLLPKPPVYLNDGAAIASQPTITLHFDDIQHMYGLGVIPYYCTCNSIKSIHAIGVQIGDIFKGILRFDRKRKLSCGRVSSAKWKIKGAKLVKKYGKSKRRNSRSKSKDPRIGYMWYCGRCARSY